MSREELLAALAELGVEAPEDATDAELLQLLDAATAGRDAVQALSDAELEGVTTSLVDENGDPVDVPEGDAAADAAAEVAAPVSPAVEAAPQPPEEPTKGRGRRSKPDATELVSCVLGPRSPAGRLLVGNAAVEAKKPGRIPRGEFDRLQAEYDLIEVEG